MPPIAEIAPLVSALIAGLSLFLTELRHRRPKSEDAGEAIRTALLELEEHLASWAEQATTTNRLAQEWAASLPDAGHPTLWLTDAMNQQKVYYADVDRALREQVGLPPPIAGGETSGGATLETLARVYAPEFFELLTVFDRRKEQMLAIGDELQRRREDPAAVAEYLRDLDSAAAGLEEARRRLAAFIAAEFPLGSASD